MTKVYFSGGIDVKEISKDYSQVTDPIIEKEYKRKRRKRKNKHSKRRKSKR